MGRLFIRFSERFFKKCSDLAAMPEKDCKADQAKD
jgi:hypothetical protein